jgi:hypothetical protein
LVVPTIAFQRLFAFLVLGLVALGCCAAYVAYWQCAPKARIISGGRLHAQSCRLIRKGWSLVTKVAFGRLSRRRIARYHHRRHDDNVFLYHIEGDGPTVFAHACKMGLEGIVSKRKDSTYRSGRSPDWLKMKNPTAPAVKREEEEEEWRK